jgi:hypothetical protein
MAVNTRNRAPVKWIRDGAKSAYVKSDCCYICGSTIELELHHTHGLTNLLDAWAKKHDQPIDTDEDVLSIRDLFITAHHKELYDDVFTLCVNHHRSLHRIYGKSPALVTAAKQAVWIEKQKDKVNGIIGSEPEKLVQQTDNSNREHGMAGRFSREIKPRTGPNSSGSWFAGLY